MAITLNLTPEQEGKLRSVAGQLNVSPQALAETAVRDLLAHPDDEFLKLARTVVGEDRELYERLRYCSTSAPAWCAIWCCPS